MNPSSIDINVENLTSVRKEAYVNEWKGHLFEFLVAQALAQKFNLEGPFLCSLGSKALGDLQAYQRQLKNLDPHLWQRLPVLAKALARDLLPMVSFPPKDIFLVSRSSKKDLIAESDILLEGHSSTADEVLGIGIKLGKYQSFINTKSGGLKSFLTQYFGEKLAGAIQLEFNRKVEISFQQMGEELYAQEGLCWPGYFDHHWQGPNRSHLPGELPVHLRKLVHQSYYRLAKYLREALMELEREDEKTFENSLFSLCGIGRKNLIQAILFHRALEKNSYEGYHCEFLTYQRIEAGLKKRFWAEYNNTASFEIPTSDWRLQIRVKPMNVFTQCSFKVNCSLRFPSVSLS